MTQHCITKHPRDYKITLKYCNNELYSLKEHSKTYYNHVILTLELLILKIYFIISEAPLILNGPPQNGGAQSKFWGGPQKKKFGRYISLIRSQLEYNSAVFYTASKTQLKKLDIMAYKKYFHK